MLFQVVDDILDGDGYVLTEGEEAARKRADRAGERAHAMLLEIPADTSVLAEIVNGLVVRTRLAVAKKRLDVLLVERGLAESRAQAQALVLAGLVPGPLEGRRAGRRGGRARGRRRRRASSRAAARSSRTRSTRSASTRRGSTASTSAHRPAGSPTFCSSAAPRA